MIEKRIKPNGRIVLVSGANGFLGSAICRHLSSSGCLVRAMVRSPENTSPLLNSDSIEIHQCDLPATIDEEAFANADTLIHCAWAIRAEDKSKSDSINLDGSRHLFGLARRNGLMHNVFVSSLSAHEHAESSYGRNKMLVERYPEIDTIVRPGLIIGSGGLFLQMYESIKKIPVVPLFFGGAQHVQFIHVDDICQAITAILDSRLTGQFNIAHPESVDIKSFYRALAERAGRRVKFIRFPGRISLEILKAAESVGIRKLPITAENLLGLKQMRVFDTYKDLERMRLNPRGLSASLDCLP